MHNTKLVQQTVDDVRELLDKILERHREDPTFCLRTESVFNQYVNSLSYITGNVNERSNIFSPKPLESIAGKKVNPRDTDKLELKPIEVDEVEAFLRDRFAAPAADARPAYELTPSPPDSAPSRRGKPTNAERQLAAAAGLTVPAFRKQQQRWAQ